MRNSDSRCPLFVQETESLLSETEKRISFLEDRPDDPDSLQQVCLAFHTIETNARTLGFSHLAELASLVEAVVQSYSQTQEPMESQALALVGRAAKVSKTQIGEVKRVGLETVIPASNTVGELGNFLRGRGS